MRLPSKCIATLVLVAGLFCLPARAEAAPIVVGSFDWIEDPFFGSIFSVTNFSDVALPTGFTFENATVTTDADPTFDTTEVLGDIAPGPFGVQTFGFFLFPTTATLTFTLPSSVLGTISIAPLSAPPPPDPLLMLPTQTTTAILYTPPPAVTPIPEPSTFLLLGAGLAFVAARVRRRR